jgi:hypothetical protein
MDADKKEAEKLDLEIEDLQARAIELEQRLLNRNF